MIGVGINVLNLKPVTAVLEGASAWCKTPVRCCFTLPSLPSQRNCYRPKSVKALWLLLDVIEFGTEKDSRDIMSEDSEITLVNINEPTLFP